MKRRRGLALFADEAARIPLAEWLEVLALGQKRGGNVQATGRENEEGGRDRWPERIYETAKNPSERNS